MINLEEIEELNEFQRKRIKERSQINFYKELETKKIERKKFKRKLLNHLDILVDELYDNCTIFYSIKIIMPFLMRNDPNTWYYTHIQVEKWISELRDGIELLEFCYFSIELNKNSQKFCKNNDIKDISLFSDFNSLEGVPYFKGIIAIRSISGDEKGHFKEMKKFFNKDYCEITLNQLSSPKSIKNYWNFIIRENNFKFHRFCQFSRFYESLYAGIADLELQYEDHYAFILDEELNSKDVDVEGIKCRDPDNVTLINYLITLYFYKKKYYLNNNNIYIKKKNFKYSWEILDSIEYIENNNINIINELKIMFPQHLTNIKISKIFFDSWDFFFAKVKHNNNYLPTIKLSKNIIEFLDGIYILDEDKFYNFDEHSFKIDLKFESRGVCLSFCNEFNKLTFPDRWLKIIESKVYSVEQFCYSLGSIFNKVFKDDSKEYYFFDKFFFKDIFSIEEYKNVFDVAFNEENIFKEELVEIIVYCNHIYKTYK